MSDMASVPAEKIAALREELHKKAHERNLNAVAWQVVDAVETEDEPDELTALRERIRALADEWDDDTTIGHATAIDLRAALGDS